MKEESQFSHIASHETTSKKKIVFKMTSKPEPTKGEAKQIKCSLYVIKGEHHEYFLSPRRTPNVF